MPKSKHQVPGRVRTAYEFIKGIEIATACRRCVAFSKSRRAGITNSCCSRSRTAGRKTPGCFD